MSMGDIFFWIGVAVGVVASLSGILAAILGWLVYDKIKSRRKDYE